MARGIVGVASWHGLTLSLFAAQGFKVEVFTKYARPDAERIYQRCETSFHGLPLASIVDGQVWLLRSHASHCRMAGY